MTVIEFRTKRIAREGDQFGGSVGDIAGDLFDAWDKGDIPFTEEGIELAEPMRLPSFEQMVAWVRGRRDSLIRPVARDFDDAA